MCVKSRCILLRLTLRYLTLGKCESIDNNSDQVSSRLLAKSRSTTFGHKETKPCLGISALVMSMPFRTCGEIYHSRKHGGVIVSHVTHNNNYKANATTSSSTFKLQHLMKAAIGLILSISLTE